MSPLRLGILQQQIVIPCHIEGIFVIQRMSTVKKKVLDSLGWNNPDFPYKKCMETIFAEKKPKQSKIRCVMNLEYSPHTIRQKRHRTGLMLESQPPREYILEFGGYEREGVAFSSFSHKFVEEGAVYKEQRVWFRALSQKKSGIVGQTHEVEDNGGASGMEEKSNGRKANLPPLQLSLVQYIDCFCRGNPTICNHFLINSEIVGINRECSCATESPLLDEEKMYVINPRMETVNSSNELFSRWLMAWVRS
ncbi:hypothetical protein L1887_18516 [Cichorium endivia]|nr:hypothetical protein L1887_18516 [Cichorium endivia]